jgi:F0F1-type ATP synthase alpha subunit
MLKERDEAEKYDYGIIIKLKDGIATVKGLKRAKSGEILYIFNQFEEANQKETKSFIKGLVLNLNLNDMDIIVLGNDNLLKEGNLVF